MCLDLCRREKEKTKRNFGDLNHGFTFTQYFLIKTTGHLPASSMWRSSVWTRSYCTECSTIFYTWLTEGSLRVVGDDGLAYLARVEQVAGDDLLFGVLLLLAGGRGSLSGKPVLARRSVHGRIVRVTVSTWERHKGLKSSFFFSLFLSLDSSEARGLVCIFNCVACIWNFIDTSYRVLQ